MAIEIVEMDFPVRTRADKPSGRKPKYDFASLVPDSRQCLVDTEVVDVKKSKINMRSAVTQYRKNCEKQGIVAPHFVIRSFTHEGKDAVAVRAVTKEVKDETTEGNDAAEVSTEA